MLIITPVLLTVLFSSARVQNYATKIVTKRISHYLGTEVSVENTQIKLFNRVVLKGVYVADFNADTLLYAGVLDIGIRGYNPVTGLIRLGDVSLGDGKFHITANPDSTTNLGQLLDKIGGGEKKESKNPLWLRVNTIRLNNLSFILKKYDAEETPDNVNFADLDIRNLNMELHRPEIQGSKVTASLKNLSFSDKSGFECQSMSVGDFGLNSTGITIGKVRLKDKFSSLDIERMDLYYDDWSELSKFSEKVTIHSSLTDLNISSRTISYFIQGINGKGSVLKITDGKVDGPVNNLTGTLPFVGFHNSVLKLSNFAISGLPHVDSANFTFDVEQLSTSAEDIDYILNRMPDNQTGGMMEYLYRMGALKVSGHFNGLISDFDADGSLVSDAGNMVFNVRMKPDITGYSFLKGDISIEDFDIGSVLEIKDMGKISVSSTTEGFFGADSLSVTTDSRITSLVYNEYEYKDIKINGYLKNNFYSGIISSDDPNLDFDFDGAVDFIGEIPRYDFGLKLRRLDLAELNINKRDSVSVVSCIMDIHGEGSTISDINGEGEIRELRYKGNQDTLYSQRIRLVADNTGQDKIVGLYSDIMDVELKSKLSFHNIIPFFRKTIAGYLPSLVPHENHTTELDAQLNRSQPNSPDNYYIIKADIKETKNLIPAIVPGLYLSEGTSLSFIYNPATDNFSLSLNSDLIEYNNMYATGLNLTNNNQADSIAFYMRATEAGLGNFYLPGLSVVGGAKNNTVNVAAGFTNTVNNTSALINTASHIVRDSLTGNNLVNTRFYSSRIMVRDRTWRISSPRITMGEGRLEFEEFRIRSVGQEQELAVNGSFSREITDTLSIQVMNFDMAPLSGLVDRYGMNITGTIDGGADIIMSGGSRLFYSQFDFRNMALNDKPLPNSVFITEWDPSLERIKVSMKTSDDKEIISGGYKPSNNRYYINFDIPNTDLFFLSPFVDNILSGIEGEGETHLVLTGMPGRTELDGTIDVKSLSVLVDFTNVRYELDPVTVKVENSSFYLKDGVLRNGTGTADFDMALTSTSLKNMNYDISIIPRNINVLNTTIRENDLFYGSVNASGSLRIKGNKWAVNLDAVATTEEGSYFVIPVGSAGALTDADFILFASPRDTTMQTVYTSRQEEFRDRIRRRREIANTKSVLDMNMRINVLQNTELTLQIDPDESNEIRGTGVGSLDLYVKPSENIFTMRGLYEIYDGEYNFSLPNFPASKEFSIQRGSTIQWTGDPVDARLNIEAVYRLRASIAPLLGTTNGTGSRQNVPVECVISLTDRLTQPTMTFDVRVPTADTEIRNVVQNALNTQEMKSSQFLWLLATNSFYVDNTAGNNIGTIATVSTGVEFLTNQLSNWFSTDKLKFSFGYRPKSDLTSDEFDVSYTQELIPDRLIIEAEANYNLGNNQAMVNRNLNQLTGDFYLTYIFDRAGNFRAKAFTRTIDRFDENQGLQESGIGLYYKKDFDNLRELLFRQRKKNE